MAFARHVLLLIALVGLCSALQLVEVPTSNLLHAPASGHKLVVTLRSRGVTSRADAEEQARLSQDSRLQLMRTHAGKQYACRIPLKAPAAGAAAGAKEATVTEEPAGASSTALAADALDADSGGSSGSSSSSGSSGGGSGNKSPAELVDQLRSLCLFRQEGLWTYEMCYKKHTRQFRQAMQRIVNNAQPEHISAEDFTCGKFAEEQDFSIRRDASTTGMPMTYISHNMTGGAPCVMTGASRTSEVRFTCMPHAKENLLVLVKEFPTCNYVFVVATPFLCSHPEFQPPPQRTTTIRCTLQELGQDQGATVPGGLHGAPPAAADTTATADGTGSAGTAVQTQPEGQCSAGEGSEQGAQCTAGDGGERPAVTGTAGSLSGQDDVAEGTSSEQERTAGQEQDASHQA